ncbi:MAG: hypothetical protein B6242_02310 [Anaerolineaceae bacterium 4572_78]|nr:MAG: hypothetical protein B6242_02310 [Anaerolineaceae bacterium 4572_78]
MNRQKITKRTNTEWVNALNDDDNQAHQDLWKFLYTRGIAIARQYQQSRHVGYKAACRAYQLIKEQGLDDYHFFCPFLGYCRVILTDEIFRIIKKNSPSMDSLMKDVAGQSKKTYDTEIQGRLQACIDELKLCEQHIITMLYMQEKNPKFIAKKLGISVNYVKTIAWYARKNLQYSFKTPPSLNFLPNTSP